MPRSVINDPAQDVMHDPIANASKEEMK